VQQERVAQLQNQQHFVEGQYSEKEQQLQQELKEAEKLHKPSLGQRIKRKVRRIFHGKEVEVEEEFDAHNAPAEGTLLHEHYEKDTVINANAQAEVHTSANVELIPGGKI